MKNSAINTNVENMDERTMEIIVQNIAAVYRKCQAAIQSRHTHADETEISYEARYIDTVDRMLACCEKHTRLIIRKSYLETDEKQWFRQYFSEGTYRREKRKALKEFVGMVDYLKTVSKQRAAAAALTR